MLVLGKPNVLFLIQSVVIFKTRDKPVDTRGYFGGGNGRMNKKIDFIVMGVPRSGTTGFAKYLDSLDTVFCGSEVFHNDRDHSTIVFPQSFQNERSKLKESEILSLAQKQAMENCLVGHKRPRYFHRLDEVTKQVPAMKIVALHRPVVPVIRSWDSKAKRQNGWKSGNIGIFAIWDFIQFSFSLYKSQHRVLLVPFQGLYYNNTKDVLADVFRFIGGSVDDRKPEFFDTQDWREKNRPPAVLSPQEDEFCRATRIEELIKMFPDDRVIMSDSCKKKLAEYFSWFRKESRQLSQLFDQLLLAEPRAEYFDTFDGLGKHLVSGKHSIAYNFPFSRCSALAMSLQFRAGNIETLKDLVHTEKLVSQMSVGQLYYCWHVLFRAGVRKEASMLLQRQQLQEFMMENKISIETDTVFQSLKKRFRYAMLSKKILKFADSQRLELQHDD